MHAMTDGAYSYQFERGEDNLIESRLVVLDPRTHRYEPVYFGRFGTIRDAWEILNYLKRMDYRRRPWMKPLFAK